MFEVFDFWQVSFKLNWHWKHVEIWPPLALKKDPFGWILKLWYSIWLEKRGSFSWSALTQPCTPRKPRAKSSVPLNPSLPHSNSVWGSHYYYHTIRGNCLRLLYLAWYESELEPKTNFLYKKEVFTLSSFAVLTKQNCSSTHCLMNPKTILILHWCEFPCSFSSLMYFGR